MFYKTQLWCWHSSLKSLHFRASPRGFVVEFGVLRYGGPGLVPGCQPTPLVCQWSCCGSSLHIKKEEDWQQMLAPGESSSAKKNPFTLLFLIIYSSYKLEVQINLGKIYLIPFKYFAIVKGKQKVEWLSDFNITVV